MIRSMSYSRYFKIATPTDTGSAATPTNTTSSTAVKAGDDVDLSSVPTRAVTATATMHTAALLISHLSCWRRSPDARRQASTWLATNTSQNTTSTGKTMPSNEPSHAEPPAAAGPSTASRSPPGTRCTLPAATAPIVTA